MRKITLFLSLIIFLTANTIFAGTTGKISGKIVDARTGEPIIGANILILNTSLGAASDMDGSFFILNVPPGKYQIKASFIGYQSVTEKEVVVNLDRTTHVDFSISPVGVQTAEVEVVAKKEGIIKDLTATSQQISAGEIQKMPVETLNDILSLQVGMTKDAGGGMHLRGGRSAEVEYIVDGISVSNPFGGGLAVSIENNTVQQLEVISGTFNAEYGRAMSGIVNIVTKEGGKSYKESISAYSGDFVSGHDDIFMNINKINPLAEKYAEGSFEGPVPFLNNTTFFSSFRVYNEEGWLYGKKNHTPGDTCNFNSADPNYWVVQSTGDGSVVSMNSSNGYTFQGKITTAIAPRLKASYSYSANYSKWQEYNHYYKYEPDYIPTRESWGMNNLLSLTHTISSNIVQELRLSYYTYKYERSKYKDPYDSRYNIGIHQQVDLPSDVFGVGTVDPSFQYNKSHTLAIKYDITDQIHRQHLLKMGIEYRTHELQDESFTVRREEATNWQLQVDDAATSFAHNYYDKKPLEISGYLQDKIEIEDFIVNAGVRYDYFDAKSYVPRDMTDPSNKRGKSFDEAYRWVKPKQQFSPRIGMAFPISDGGSIHASYGEFFQIPEFSRLYENPKYKVTGTFSSFVGNADLDAQRTTIYEIGIQQKLTPTLILDATCYYKDIRNLAGASLYQTFDIVDYGQYTNKDYGSVWGITLALDLLQTGLLSSNIDYTYQVADGNGSDPKQAFYDAANKDESTKTLVPLNWDQRHVLNWVVNVSGEDWGVSAITQIHSGTPYTPTTSYSLTENTQLLNLGRRKGQFNIDLKCYKNITVAGVTAQIFMKIENLLDQTLDEYMPQLTQLELAAHSKLNYLNSLYEYRFDPSSQPKPRLVKVGFSVNL